MYFRKGMARLKLAGTHHPQNGSRSRRSRSDESMTSIPKPRPKLLERRDSRSFTDAVDRTERNKCRKRSQGRCEVWEQHSYDYVSKRCTRRAFHNHHLISGSGRRNTGLSIMHEHRLDVCPRCHADITGHVLRPVDGTTKHDASLVCYERAR